MQARSERGEQDIYDGNLSRACRTGVIFLCAFSRQAFLTLLARMTNAEKKKEKPILQAIASAITGAF